MWIRCVPFMSDCQNISTAWVIRVVHWLPVPLAESYRIRNFGKLPYCAVTGLLQGDNLLLITVCQVPVNERLSIHLGCLLG